MEKNKKSPNDCENCAIQSRIIQKYSEEILDLQRQVSALSSRLIKYESDPPAEELCLIKIENKSDDEFISDQNTIPQNADDDNLCKDVSDFYSETSRDNADQPDYDNTDAEEASANLDEDDDSSQSDTKKVVRSKKATTRKMRKCKTCDQEFSSSRALLRHNHEIHGNSEEAQNCSFLRPLLIPIL